MIKSFDLNPTMELYEVVAKMVHGFAANPVGATIGRPFVLARCVAFGRPVVAPTMKIV